MQTTMIRDSSVGDEWIRRMIIDNPIQWVIDKDGNRTANVLTGPVRLDWPFLLEQRKKKVKDPTTGVEQQVDGGYETSVLFPPGVDFTSILEAYNAVLAMDCQDYFDKNTNQYVGLHSPFRDQVEKAVGAKPRKGYAPGSIFMTCTNSKFAPQVVDVRGNPIVDKTRVYSGVWAILSINAYSYGIKKQQAKKGVKFGIISVMIVADDDRFDQGFTVDVKQQFSNVKGVVPPTVQPSAMFGSGQAGGMQVMPNTNAAFVTPPAPAVPHPMAPAPSMMPAAAPMQNFAPPPLAAPQVKNCWACQNIIPATAAVCQHCNSQQA